MKTCLCEVFGFCHVWPSLVWPSPAQPRPAQARPAQTQLGAGQPCNVSGLARILVHFFTKTWKTDPWQNPGPFGKTGFPFIYFGGSLASPKIIAALPTAFYPKVGQAYQLEEWKLKNWKLRIENWKLKTGSWKLRTANWKLKVGNRKVKIESWKLKIGNWNRKMEIGNKKIEIWTL